MSALRQIAIILLVIFAIIALFLAIQAFDKKDQSFMNLFNAYKSKGKDSQMTVDDVRKGFK